MSMQRLRTDPRFAALTLFSAVAVLAVAPFAVYRFASGATLAGALDVMLVLSLCGGTLHAWRGGDLDTTATVMVAALMAGYLLTIELVGLAALHWMYPLLIGNFLIVPRGRALALALAAIGFLALRGTAFDGPLQAIVFAFTTLLTSLFAYIFAQRTEYQRRQLESLADHDALTGAFNRRSLTRELQGAIDVARRSGAPAGLLLMDLDQFKCVNDIKGHEHGDRVLVEFADLVRSHARQGDCFFRTGGEEFLLLAPGTGAAQLRTMAERLRAAAESGLRCGEQPVTVSMGAAVLRNGEAAQQWLARADASMYEAKRNGRNRVEGD
jgi:diguanylate cyclase (GGDEF)-like protein